MMVHDHRATSLRLPHELVYVRVWEREVLHGVTRGLPCGLEGARPAPWDVSREA